MNECVMILESTIWDFQRRWGMMKEDGKKRIESHVMKAEQTEWFKMEENKNKTVLYVSWGMTELTFLYWIC